METENLKYLLKHGQEAMNMYQIADAFKEANNLIKMKDALLKEIEVQQKEYEQLHKMYTEGNATMEDLTYRNGKVAGLKNFINKNV